MDKKSGIENPSKSEVIGRCGGDEKTEWPRRTDKIESNPKKRKQKKKITSWMTNIEQHQSISIYLFLLLTLLNEGTYVTCMPVYIKC